MKQKHCGSLEFQQGLKGAGKEGSKPGEGEVSSELSEDTAGTLAWDLGTQRFTKRISCPIDLQAAGQTKGQRQQSGLSAATQKAQWLWKHQNHLPHIRTFVKTS